MTVCYCFPTIGVSTDLPMFSTYPATTLLNLCWFLRTSLDISVILRTNLWPPRLLKSPQYICSELGMTYISLIQDVGRTWNSTWKMEDRLLQLQCPFEQAYAELLSGWLGIAASVSIHTTKYLFQCLSVHRGFCLYTKHSRPASLWYSSNLCLSVPSIKHGNFCHQVCVLVLPMPRQSAQDFHVFTRMAASRQCCWEASNLSVRSSVRKDGCCQFNVSTQNIIAGTPHTASI